MEDKYLSGNISPATFDQVLARYENVVPAKLADLEKARLEDIPLKLTERKESGDAFLELEEVVRLVEWKLSHGTFRPTLLSLVKSNSAATIKSTTQHAFTLLPSTPDVSSATILPALNHLTTLRGIGPATASLLLSTHSPDDIPFFSDELYRWLRFGDGPDATGPGKGTSGWERKCGYTVKEYGRLVDGLGVQRERMKGQNGGVGERGARDWECVAYVLGRTKGVPMDDEDAVDGTAVKAASERKATGDEVPIGDVQAKSIVKQGRSRSEAKEKEKVTPTTKFKAGDSQARVEHNNKHTADDTEVVPRRGKRQKPA